VTGCDAGYFFDKSGSTPTCTQSPVCTGGLVLSSDQSTCVCPDNVLYGTCDNNVVTCSEGYTLTTFGSSQLCSSNCQYSVRGGSTEEQVSSEGDCIDYCGAQPAALGYGLTPTGSSSYSCFCFLVARTAADTWGWTVAQDSCGTSGYGASGFVAVSPL